MPTAGARSACLPLLLRPRVLAVLAVHLRHRALLALRQGHARAAAAPHLRAVRHTRPPRAWQRAVLASAGRVVPAAWLPCWACPRNGVGGALGNGAGECPGCRLAAYGLGTPYVPCTTASHGRCAAWARYWRTYAQHVRQGHAPVYARAVAYHRTAALYGLRAALWAATAYPYGRASQVPTVHGW